MNDIAYPVKFTSLQEEGWSLTDESTQNLLDKLKSKGVPLGDYVEKKIYYGIKTGLNEAFVIDQKTRDDLIAQDPKSAELIKPFLAGRDIKRYQPLKPDKFLIFTRRGINIKNYPAIETYLIGFKERLLPKPKDWKPKNPDDKWKGRKPGNYHWYEIQDAVDYYEEFEKPKIIIPAIIKNPSFVFDSQIFFLMIKQLLLHRVVYIYWEF